MNAEQLCKLFGVHRSTILRWVKRGCLPPPISLLATLRWRRDAIEPWLRKLEEETAAARAI
jgi:predicted DNA-binding transcriptional regulator AlpA